MKGLELMLASLLGMKPEEMRAKVEQAVSLMETGAKSAATIEADIKAIKKHLGIEEFIEERDVANGGTAIANRRNSANSHSVQL